MYGLKSEDGGETAGDKDLSMCELVSNLKADLAEAERAESA